MYMCVTIVYSIIFLYIQICIKDYFNYVNLPIYKLFIACMCVRARAHTHTHARTHARIHKNWFS